jgi:hypothetical protein
MFWKKKTDIGINVDAFDPTVVWSNDNMRIIRNRHNDIIVEEKFHSLFYDEEVWLAATENNRVKAVENAYKDLLRRISLANI